MGAANSGISGNLVTMSTEVVNSIKETVRGKSGILKMVYDIEMNA